MGKKEIEEFLPHLAVDRTTMVYTAVPNSDNYNERTRYEKETRYYHLDAGHPGSRAIAGVCR